MSNQPQNQQSQAPQKPAQRLKEVIYKPSVQEQFKNAMGDNAGLFTASLIDAYSNDTNLQKCEPSAVVMEALKAATLKLPINRDLGFAYVVPYKNKPQMQIGYKGYIQLAMRTGQYRHINADKVFEGELKGHDKITGKIDLSGEKQSDNVIGYFAYIETVQGFQKISYWTKSEVVEHAKKYSQSYNSSSSAWKTNFDAMAKKTVLKHLLSKYGTMSVELAHAIQNDEQDKADAEAGDNANGDFIDIDPQDGEPEQEPQGEDPQDNKGNEEPQDNEATGTDGPGF